MHQTGVDVGTTQNQTKSTANKLSKSGNRFTRCDSAGDAFMFLAFRRSKRRVRLRRKNRSVRPPAYSANHNRGDDFSSKEHVRRHGEALIGN